MENESVKPSAATTDGAATADSVSTSGSSKNVAGPDVFMAPPSKNSPLPMILMAVLAVVGIGFGVYGMFFSGNRTETNEECPECKECVETQKISDEDLNTFAVNLVAPYIIGFGSGSNVFDSGLAIDTKMLITALKIYHDSNKTNFPENELKVEYAKLFGKNDIFENRNIDLGIKYAANLTYNNESGYSLPDYWGTSGTGVAFVASIIDSYNENNQLVAELYYGKLTAEQLPEELGDSLYSTYIINKSYIENNISDFEETISLHKMYFEREDNHFVLVGIE